MVKSPPKVNPLPKEYRNELKKSDTSIYPSYTRVALPYFVKCRQRFHLIGDKYRDQAMRELLTQETLQSKALDGVRLHRHFAQCVLEYKVVENPIPTLTTKEQLRLETILNSTIY